MRSFIALVIVSGLAAAASAQQITNPNDITLQHDFNSAPPVAPPAGPFTLGMATFSEASTGAGGRGWRLIPVFQGGFGRQLTDNAGISNITIDFSTPMLRAGLDVGIGPARFQVEFFNGNTSLGSVTQSVQIPEANFFAGWQNAAGITRIVITEPSGENGLVGGIDNVRYDIVPAPGAVTLLGLGGIAALRRRRA